MILHRDGATSRRGDAGGLPASVPELGRNLRRARTRQGLRLEDVSLRTGLAVGQLEALEAGTVDRIPDRIGVLQTLRRYADYLGLPGDRYSLSLVDLWPAATAAAGPVVVVQAPATSSAIVGPGVARGIETGAVPVIAVSRSPAAAPAPAGAPASGPFGTAAVTGSEGVHSNTAQVPLGLDDTGVVPVVPGADRSGPRPRRPRAPLLLGLVVALVALAVVAGVAGLVIHQVEPKWLNSLGITHSRPPKAGPPHPVTPPGGVFAVASTSSTGATFDIRAPAFLVRVIPVGSASWMQATDAQHVSPIFAGVLGSGQSKDFLVTQSITVEVGSPSAHVFVSVGSKVVGFYFPTAAPYTMTFHSVAS